MRYSSVKARKMVRMAIVAYCHELFLNCSVSKVYDWGNYLDPESVEAQNIVRITRKKLGYKKTMNDRDIFWIMQCTWRQMVERNQIESHRPKQIPIKNN